MTWDKGKKLEPGPPPGTDLSVVVEILASHGIEPTLIDRGRSGRSIWSVEWECADAALRAQIEAEVQAAFVQMHKERDARRKRPRRLGG